MGQAYVIYYGWLTGDGEGEPNREALRIAAARPPLLVANLRAAPPAGHVNLSRQVLARIRAAGTQVFGYVPTGFGRAGLEDVRRAVADNLDAGLDGILFDEADPLTTRAKVGYYATLAGAVHRDGRKVVLNTGVSNDGERIMELADFLMVEHQWRGLRADSPWAARYAPERFMGVSSNEEGAMHYRVDGPRAAHDAREAWRLGIGWHAATDRYTELPDWFEAHFKAVST